MALYSTRDAPDIEEWAAKSAAYHGGAGIAARLFSAIRNSMTALITSTAATKNKEALQSCRNNYERFSLWGQDLLVGDGDLDQVLYQAKELRAQVLSVLSRLGTIVLEAIYLGSGTLSQVSKEQCNDLQDVLDTVDTMLKDTSVEERTMVPSSPTSESTSPDLDIADLLEEISDYVDCLLDLSSALDNPALDIERDNPEDPPAQIRESFEVSSEEAMIYCRKIKDRFENLPKYLVERLAEANVSRATTVREKRAQPVKETDIHEDAITERLFTTSNPHPSNTTKSTASGPSVFSSIQSQAKLSLQRPTQLIDDETRSEATFASFSTAASALRHGRPRVPLMPEIQGDVFDCPICSSPISDVRNRQQWKKHVFDDLQPYLCTIKDCPDMVLYSSSEEWAHHEKSHTSSSTSHSVECAFCSANYLTEGPSYYKHVSAHLREISLSILPQTVEDDEDDENDEEIDSDLGHLSVALAGPEELRHEHEENLPKIEPGSPTQNQGLPRHEGPVQVPSSSLGNSASTQPVVEGKTPVDAPELEIDIDSIIDRLIKLKSLRSMPTHKELTEDEIKFLCTKAREIFLGQPSLLELVAPLKIIGDLRGQFDDLLRTFELSGFPPEANYVLLGNYVGLYLSTNSIETLCLIIAYKIKYPENFFPLRGNNEARTARTSSQLSAFFEECKIRYNVKLWELFVGVFDSMPLAAVVDDKIFCVQGGLSPDLHSMDQIKQIARPTDVPESGLLCDLLWSDADRDIVGWGEHERGISFTFGPDVVSHFLQKHEFDLIVRGHQVVEDGYEFFVRRQFVTLFGATNYMGEFNNKAAVMSVDENLLCSFNILDPLRKPPLKPRQRKPPLKPQSRVK